MEGIMCDKHEKYICKICGKKCKSFRSLSRHIPFHKIKTLDYMIRYEGFQIPKCPICGKDCVYGDGISFRKTCGSVECNAKLHKITCLSKYGVSNPSKSGLIKDKKKKTTLNHYGVENPFQSEDIKDKIKKINLEKYGVENPGQSEKIKEKIKNTFLKNYGVDCASKSDKVKEKAKKTCLEKYGVENPGKSDIVKEKMKKTCLERYGVDCSLKSELVKSKRRKTCFEKYDSTEFFGSDERRLKVLQDSLDKGIERYSDEFNDIRIENWKICGTCKICGHRQQINNSVSYERKLKNKVPVCTKCNPIHKQYSVKEKQLCDFIKSIYKGSIIENDRTILRPRELDVYLPDLNLAFEFNGDYWHSKELLEKQGRPSNYHDEKIKLCGDKGIKLIQIWEHDWDNNRNCVESLIRKECLL